MKKFSFLLALLFIFTQSCQPSKQKAALDFSNKLSEISKANQTKWKKIGGEIANIAQSHDYAHLTILYNDITSFLDKKITELNSMKDVSGSEDLKNAMIEFLKFDREFAHESLKPYTLMKPETPDEELQAATSALVKAAEREEPYLSKLQATQRAYAKRNGFKLDESNAKP